MTSSQASDGEWRKLIENRQWADAVLALRAELKETPQREELIEMLARALVFDRRREEALALLSTAESKETLSARKERWRARIRVVSALFVEDLTFQIFQRGLNLWAAGDLEGARRKLEEAHLREPNHGGILIRQGQLAVLMQMPQFAAEKLRLARIYNPFEAEAEYWLAEALEADHDLVHARKSWEDYRAHRPSPSAGTPRGILLQYRLTKDFDKSSALRALEQAVRRAREPLAIAELGLSYLEERAPLLPDAGTLKRISDALRGPSGSRSFGFGEGFVLTELPSEKRYLELRERLKSLSKISSTDSAAFDNLKPSWKN